MIESVEVIIRQPGFPERVVPLQEGETRLGRADDNEIVLSDVGVSRRHAQIVLKNGEVHIEDLGSGNGTYYFGHRVKSQPLKDQDEVVIDPFILQFRVRGEPSSVTEQGTGDPATVPMTEGVHIVVVVGNGMEGSVFPIYDDGLTMGRAEDRDIVIPDPASSRHHCKICLEAGEYVLHDNGSANGVFVNAVRVRECTLSDGDLVRIGNTEMRFVNPFASEEWTGPVPDGPSEDFHSEPAVVSSHTQSEPSESDEDPGSKNLIFAAVGGVLLLGALALALFIIVVAGAIFLSSSGVRVEPLPPQQPTWTLVLPDAPEADVQTRLSAGMEATTKEEHGTALEYYFRVLKEDPGNNTAIKFASFSASAMLSDQLAEETEAAIAAQKDYLDRRAYLLRQVKSRYVKRVRKARSALTEEYRDDLVVQEAMNWGLTEKQRNAADLADRIEQYVKTDRYAEAIRLADRFLGENRNPQLRKRVAQLRSDAVAALAKTNSATWRQAVLLERQGDNDGAIALYKKIISSNPENPSAVLRLAELEAR